MAQFAYRTRYCGWTLEQATDEVACTIGLVKVTHGPDYRHMVDYYQHRVLPSRERGRSREATTPGGGNAALQTAAHPSAVPALVR
jgi:hypothetical protein